MSRRDTNYLSEESTVMAAVVQELSRETELVGRQPVQLRPEWATSPWQINTKLVWVIDANDGLLSRYQLPSVDGGISARPQ